MYQRLGTAMAGAIGTAGAIVCLGTGRPALGQTVCDSIGADVIVGSIPDADNFTSSGGIEAFSIATTSCNIGDTELLWIANSTNHPVIGQNMFDLLLCFGLPAVPGCESQDVNADGSVDVLDLIDLLLAFGSACP